MIPFRRCLRAAEAVDLWWDQIDFARSRLHVRRVKKGSPAVHPLDGVELRALRRLQREAPQYEFAFVSERVQQGHPPWPQLVPWGTARRAGRL
jgi:integrase